MKQENKTIIIKVPQIIVDKIDAIKEKDGITFTSEVIRNAVTELYNSKFKSYGYAKDALSSGIVLREPKMTKAQKEEKQQHEICMILDGTVDTNEAGFKSCTYDIHEKVNPKLVNHFKQTLPFGMLTKDTIARQYSPSKEEVIQTMNELASNS
jgi:hypothetical protein